MVVHLIDGLDRNEFATLISRLEAEQFADGCVIGKIEPIGHAEERKLRIQLPNSQHGVLLAAGHIDDAAIDWAVDALRLSIWRA
jgi:hypothetical protein